MKKSAAILLALSVMGMAALAQDMKTYAKYDFVPGDKIIFEDDLLNEQPDEFPSKWDLVSGRVEVRKVNGENVITMIDGSYASITPLMSKPNYLPDVFTLEFDVYIKGPEHNDMHIWFNGKDTETEMEELTVGSNVRYGDASGSYPNPDELLNKWYHLAIAFNVRSLKAYINQHRVLNTPVTTGKPVGITICGLANEDEGVTQYIKNIRLAAGGADLYKRVITDGKFITRGIKFDVNKATIKSESMGVLNEIARLLREHPELKFSVEGHTDSDGDDAANLKLSQARAEAVKAQLAMMGIEATRLTCKGFGETKPADSNTTPIGKANNRRVEFVKL